MLPTHLSSACAVVDFCRNPQCAEAVKVDGDPKLAGKWFITINHAGFNSPANNRDGYRTRSAAVAAWRRYSARKGGAR